VRSEWRGTDTFSAFVSNFELTLFYLISGSFIISKFHRPAEARACSPWRRDQLKCDGTHSETRFRLSAKQTSPFKSAGGHEVSRLLAAEVCASAVIMLDIPCSEVVWRVLATHSIRQFPLQFPSCASPCAITFQLEFITLITNSGIRSWNSDVNSPDTVSILTRHNLPACVWTHWNVIIFKALKKNPVYTLFLQRAMSPQPKKQPRNSVYVTNRFFILKKICGKHN